MSLDYNQKAFFGLLRAGLWGNGNDNVNDNHSFEVEFGDVDWDKVYILALEQSVQGLVLQGIEEFKERNLEISISQDLLLQWIGEVQVLEQQNVAMNGFVAWLIELLRKENIYALLVKGQGIAQCYEKPLWRVSGDVDLLLSEDNYEKAKKVLLPLATDVETEYSHFKHQGMTINCWVVELHGTLHSRLSKCVDKMIDEAQKDVFYGGKVRSVVFNVNPNANHNESTDSSTSVQVFLPAPDEDVIFVFTHILHHFFFEGIGLRQICDWCRLLWTYKDSLNHGLLESRIRMMGLMSEWKAFAALAVDYLGMPAGAMPLFDDNDNLNANLKRKAAWILKFVMKVGNFGHKQRRDYSGMSYLKRKLVSGWGRLNDMLRHFQVFPKDSIVFFGGVLRSGLHAAVRGE